MERIVGYVFWVFFILFAAYIALATVPSDLLPSIDWERIISQHIASIAQEAWSFSKPLLQLAIILLILGSVLRVAQERYRFFTSFQLGDVKSALALLIVASFCLAALSGSPTTGFLENVALVVVGFYFGSQVKDPTLSTKSREPLEYEKTNPFE